MARLTVVSAVWESDRRTLPTDHPCTVEWALMAAWAHMEAMAAWDLTVGIVPCTAEAYQAWAWA